VGKARIVGIIEAVPRIRVLLYTHRVPVVLNDFVYGIGVGNKDGDRIIRTALCGVELSIASPHNHTRVFQRIVHEIHHALLVPVLALDIKQLHQSSALVGIHVSPLSYITCP
jgi:hypothetical protein